MSQLHCFVGLCLMITAVLGEVELCASTPRAQHSRPRLPLEAEYTLLLQMVQNTSTSSDGGPLGTASDNSVPGAGKDYSSGLHGSGAGSSYGASENYRVERIDTSFSVPVQTFSPEAQAAKTVEAAAAVASAGSESAKLEASFQDYGGSSALRAAAADVKQIRSGEAAQGRQAFGEDDDLNVASDEIGRLVEAARSDVGRGHVDARSGEDAFGHVDVHTGRIISSSAGADVRGSMDSASDDLDSVRAATEELRTWISNAASASIDSTGVDATAKNFGQGGYDRKVAEEQSVAQSWQPWRDIERNLTQLAKHQSDVIDSATSALELATSMLDMNLSQREKASDAYSAAVDSFEVAKQSYSTVSFEADTAAAKKNEVCSRADAVVANIEEFRKSYDDSEAVYDKLAERMNADAIQLNMSLTDYENLEANSSSLQAAAVDSVRTSAALGGDLQEAIRELNRLNDELNAADDASDALASKSLKVEQVHEQAKVVAQSTANLTELKKFENDALSTAGDVAAKMAKVSSEASWLRKQFFEDKAAFAELAKRRSAVEASLRRVEADAAASRDACDDATKKSDAASKEAASFELAVDKADAAVSSALNDLRKANWTVDDAWSRVVKARQDLEEANVKMKVIRDALLNVDRMLADTSREAPSGAYRVISDMTLAVNAATAQARQSSSRWSSERASYSARFASSSGRAEVWQANGKAATMVAAGNSDREPGSAIFALCVILAFSCTLALFVIACNVRAPRGAASPQTWRIS
eukprot:TRINITY_DN1970_c0_g1_i3.p1 TRINITY_DN1970_c0_g1~~TRINITY_DN1970_c0_g1_i3.p1  ORF type:complete len:783 (-),score=170.72 TRINITY_DN1970_c0_g1_i3:341-2623(-)